LLLYWLLPDSSEIVQGTQRFERILRFYQSLRVWDMAWRSWTRGTGKQTYCGGCL